MEIAQENRADLVANIDLSDLIAQAEVELFVAGLTWRSPLVVHCLHGMGCPSRHWMNGDHFEGLLERLAIVIVDGGLHV